MPDKSIDFQDTEKHIKINFTWDQSWDRYLKDNSRTRGILPSSFKKLKI